MNELLDATNAAVATGGAIGSWIPTIVGSAPSQSVDDTAVVVITARPSDARNERAAQPLSRMDFSGSGSAGHRWRC